MPLPQLRRVRWAVRATLALGVAASVVANILHAQENPISQAIAAWPPLALLLTVELISRVPVHRRSLAFARLAATATIAGIAAWVSYWHMAGVAAKYGERGASPYLLPLSVDGLIVVASICLVELSGRISEAEAEARAAADARGVAKARTTTDSRATAEARAARPTAGNTVPASTGAEDTATKAVASATGRVTPKTSGTGRATTGASGSKPAKASAGRPRRPVAETAALAAAIEADRPDASEADVAQELGITPARLRAVRRQARELELAA